MPYRQPNHAVLLEKFGLEGVSRNGNVIKILRFENLQSKRYMLATQKHFYIQMIRTSAITAFILIPILNRCG